MHHDFLPAAGGLSVSFTLPRYILHVDLNKSSKCYFHAGWSLPVLRWSALRFVGLSECDPLHKQVTLLSNGLLCHSCTFATSTRSRFLPGRLRWWMRAPAALHKPRTISSKRETDLLLGATPSVMEGSDTSWGNKEAGGAHRDPQCFASRFLVGHIGYWVWAIKRQKSFSLSVRSYSASYTCTLISFPLSPLSFFSLLLFIHPSCRLSVSSVCLPVLLTRSDCVGYVVK